jgi:hypothetical protein
MAMAWQRQRNGNNQKMAKQWRNNGGVISIMAIS